MRISLLLIAVVLGSMLVGCGSVNHGQTKQKPINTNDPMMTSRYLSNRAHH